MPNARILDPNILGPSFTRQQNIRNYFDFNPSLDIDRYTVNGKTQDYVVAVRELDQSKLRRDQQNWINLHLSYTHGNGFVAAPANRAEDDGFPAFTVKDLPVSAPAGSDFEALHSQIYYGEKSPSYSIVDTKQGEIDGPGSSDTSSDESLTHYEGTGGVKLDSGFRKLLYRKPAPGEQTELPLGEASDGLTARKLPCLAPLKWDEDFPGYAVEIQSGLALDEVLKLKDVELHDFTFEALEGGSCKVKFALNFTQDGRTSGKLCQLIQETVEFTLTPPAKGDTQSGLDRAA